MKFLADENFNNRILRGVLREYANFDVIRVQDTEIYQADDPVVLAWAAEKNRILLTHDIKTIPKYAYKRVNRGEFMPGVIAIPLSAPIGDVINDLVLSIGASEPDDFENQVVFLPL